MTFWNMSKKFWPNMLLFSSVGKSGLIRKNHFYHKLIFFLELYIREKFWIIQFYQWIKSYEEFQFAGSYGFPILSWTLKSFIWLNFQYFLKKIKIIRYRLFITTFQLLRLTFFNSITKFLTILYFELFCIFSYLLFLSYMVYNSKWCEYLNS